MEKEYFDIDCQEWWEAQREKDRKAQGREIRRILMRPFTIKRIAEIMGGGEGAEKYAAMFVDAFEDKLPDIPAPQAEKREENSAPVKPGQGESSLVKPETPDNETTA